MYIYIYMGRERERERGEREKEGVDGFARCINKQTRIHTLEHSAPCGAGTSHIVPHALRGSGKSFSYFAFSSLSLRINSISLPCHFDVALRLFNIGTRHCGVPDASQTSYPTLVACLGLVCCGLHIHKRHACPGTS